MTAPFTGPEVSLSEVLEARERRAALQAELLTGGASLISYTLNIPGPVKRSPLTDRAFEIGWQEVELQLTRRGWTALQHRQVSAPTGLEGFWLVDVPAHKVKAAMVAIEEGHGLGRLFDIDVLAGAGQIVDRAQIGLPPRGCLVCGAPGAGCARSRAHGIEELQRATRTLITDYIDGRLAEQIAQNALRSMLYEVSVTPKPGLVDRLGSGAHTDMDLFTFIDSAAALCSYFRDMALIGCRSRDIPPTKLLARLRYRGIQAEEAMQAATGGVNTHKGLIFSLGLVAAACGYLGEGPEAKDPEAILRVVAEAAAPTIEGDLLPLTAETARTAGERLFARHRIAGVRGEAAAGFPAVGQLGLPLMRRLVSEGWSLEQAGVAVLLHLIATVEDTNLIHRSNPETQRRIAREVAHWLEAAPRSPEDYLAEARRLDAQFTRENLSPGGCADLLALTFMLYFTTR